VNRNAVSTHSPSDLRRERLRARSSMRALIIGAGIGGLSAAIALHKVGISATVLEQAPQIQEVGAGLSLWSNAVKALRQMGLEQRIVPLGSVIESAKTFTAEGCLLIDIDMRQLNEEAGAPSICIHRADLQQCLMDMLQPHVVVTNAKCIGLRQDAHGVKVLLENGKTEVGDFLIGADGIDSIVRRELVDSSASRYAGYTCWRGVVDFVSSELHSGQTILAIGRGSQIGLFPCGTRRTYWFATKNAAEDKPDSPEVRKAEVAKLSENWMSPIRAVIASTDEGAIIKNDVRDRPPLRSWGRDRVTLLGDAAHPTTPNLGQGACQALEDAVILAYCLRNAESPMIGLRAYEALRYKRTSEVIRASWRLGRFLQHENAAVVWFRNSVSQTTLARRLAMAAFRKLLCFNVPALNEPAAPNG
jgi:2-polyprenyl-6-methoxyphenol hydroxylase-like FAD-dependent oxidoreductase